MKIFAKTKDITKEEWLKLRTNGIGGSDVSSIAGLNPFKSAFQVWMEKAGLMVPEDTGSDITHFGHVLEPVIRKEFSERTGLKVQVRNCMFQHEEHSFMLADLDGVIQDSKEGFCIFEAKTASAFKAKQWEKGVPEEYQLQIQHYMAVTGAAKTYVAALIGGNQFVWYEVHRDAELICLIIEMERDFWESHVLKQIPPEVDGSKATTEYLAQKYPGTAGTTKELPEAAEEYIAGYENVSGQIKALEEQKQELGNRLKDLLKDNEVGVCHGRVVSWKVIEKEQFDQKAFSRENPSEYGKYLKHSSYRRLQVA